MVPCEVNGLRLKFVFDTGASTVSLSLSTAEFMLKNDYLSADKIYNVQTMVQADGTSFKAYNVMLDKLVIGGCVLNNIEATITPYQDAPLLLGQSAIQKLGRITIKDNYLIIDDSSVNYVSEEKDIAFLGLKLGTDYDTCWKTMENKYGKDNVYWAVINDAIRGIEVDEMYFINQKFDKIYLYFDDNDCLYSVVLERHFKKNELSSVIKFRDLLFSILSNKYNANKSVVGNHTNNNIKDYYLGYVHKKDKEYYPISITVHEETDVVRAIDGEPQKKHLYKVILSYWPLNLELLYEQYPVEEEY